MRELRQAVRVLFKSPLPTAFAVAILSLGIGGNTAFFSVANAVLIRPLAFDASDRIVSVTSTFREKANDFVSMADFADYRSQTRSFEGLAAVRGANGSVSTPDGAEMVQGVAVSQDFFSVFNVHPILGRTFDADDFNGVSQPVVLSHSLWMRLFGGRPDAIGATLRLRDEPVTVVGIMPEGFRYPRADVWRPLTIVPTESSRSLRLVTVVGRLKNGVTLPTAQSDLSNVATELARLHPRSNDGWNVAASSLQTQLTRGVRRPIQLLWAASLCLLLIACASLAALQLARNLWRRSEFSIRFAIGASATHMIRQILTECVVLTFIAMVGGVVVTLWTLGWLRHVLPPDTPGIDAVALDGRVLMFGILLGVVTVSILSAFPVYQMLHHHRLDITRTRSATRHHAGMYTLCVVQIGLALVLVFGASLMVRTLNALPNSRLGFDSHNLVTFYVPLPSAQYRQPTEITNFFSRLLEGLRKVPGVESASAVNALYVHWGNAMVLPVAVEGRPTTANSRPPDTHIRMVDIEVHDVLRIPVLQGRTFRPSDVMSRPMPVVINQAMADAYFRGEFAVGHRLSFLNADGKPVWNEVIGVVGNVRQNGLDADSKPEVQLPYQQAPVNQMAIVVRTPLPPASVMPEIKRQISSLDSTVPITYVQTMDDVLSESIEDRKVTMALLAAFAIFGVAVMSVGLYGVVSTLTAQRSHEVAIRLALGASETRIMVAAIGATLTVVGAGLGVGVVASRLTVRLIEPLLFAVSASQPDVYLSAALLLVVIALLSVYFPIHKVAATNAAEVLKNLPSSL